MQRHLKLYRVLSAGKKKKCDWKANIHFLSFVSQPAFTVSIPQGLNRLQGVISKFLQSSLSLNLTLTRKDRFELPVLQDMAVTQHQQSWHFNQQCSYSRKQVSDLQPNHAKENCIHTPWHHYFSVIHYCSEAGRKPFLFLLKKRKPFSLEKEKAFSLFLSDLQRGRRGKKQHTSSPQSHQGSFTPNCWPSLTSGLQLDRTAAQHPPGWKAFLPPSLKTKGKAVLPKAENKALEALCSANLQELLSAGADLRSSYPHRCIPRMANRNHRFAS